MEINVYKKQGVLTRFFSELKFLILSPREFFEILEFRKNLPWAVSFYLMVVIITYLLKSIVDLFALNINILHLKILFFVIIVSPIISLIIFHPLIKLFKGTGSAKDTLLIVLFANSAVIFYLIPFWGNYFYLFWAILLQILGISAFHKLSITRSSMILSIPYSFFLFLRIWEHL